MQSKPPAASAGGAAGAGSGDAKAPKVVVTVTAASPVAAGGAGAAAAAAAGTGGGDDDTLPAPMTPLVRIDSVAKRAVSEVAKRMPRPLVVCGPSGVGKGTLVGRLLKDFPTHFGKSVSHTTRKPRPGEVNGTSYHFVTLDDIKQGIADHKFVENAVYAGNHYGTSVASVQAVAHTGRICILEIDIQGAETIRARSLTDADFIQPNYLFILPPDLPALVTRLQVRGTETDDTLLLRMETARDELLKLSTTVTYFQNKIVNHDLQHAFTAFCLSLCDCYPHLKEAIDTAALLAAADAAPAAAAKPLTAEQATSHVQRLLSESQQQIDTLKRTRAANAASKAAAAAGAGAGAGAAGAPAAAAAAHAPAHAPAAAGTRTHSNGATAGAGAKPSTK